MPDQRSVLHVHPQVYFVVGLSIDQGLPRYTRHLGSLDPGQVTRISVGEVSGLVGFGRHGIDQDVVELGRLLPDHAVTRIVKDVEPLVRCQHSPC